MSYIQAKTDKSDFGDNDEFLNLMIDGEYLDKRLDKLFPGQMYKGLVPTLLFWMVQDNESKVVWKRILPAVHTTTICPVLMCPDDCDFSCTLVVAEIENKQDHIIWKRLGRDNTNEFDAEKVGSVVEWYTNIEPMTFEYHTYVKMIKDFKEEFEREKTIWEKKNKKH